MSLEVIIGISFNVLFTVVSIAFIWGKVVQQVSNQAEDVGRLRNGLYKKDGTLVYVTREECMKTNDDFKEIVSDQIQELKTMLTDLRAEVVNRNVEYTKELRSLNKFMGGVEQALKMLDITPPRANEGS